MDYLTTLMEERETLASTMETTVARAQERGTDLTQAETAEIQRIQARCAEIDTNLATFAAAQEQNRAYADLRARIGKGREERGAQRQEQESTEPSSLGEAFVESAEFRGYHGSGTSGRMEYRAADTIMTTDLKGIPTLRISGPAESNVEDRFPLFGLVNSETVGSGAFEYVKTTWTDAADVVAEGALKPQADYKEDLVPGSLDTIAHWVGVSRQALEDRDRLRSIIDGRLTMGVQRKIHAEIVAALAAASATIPDVTAADLLTGIRQGVGVVEAAGWFPSVVLLNPEDHAKVDLEALKATLGLERRSSVWGLRAVSSAKQAKGTALVGDFAQGVTLFRRSGVSVYATDSHGDTFTHNIITILAEARAKAVVTDATAMVEVKVSGAPATTT
jgi:HK97 family phage major capsid protein